MVEVGQIIAEAIKNHDNEEVLKSLKERSMSLCKKYPLYPNL